MQIADDEDLAAAPARLELEGFITISPQQGILVRDLSFQDIADQYEIRIALESFVLRQEANLGDQNVEGAVWLDADFHTLFCEFLGNQEILRVLGQLRDKMHRVISRVFTLNPGRILTSYQEHGGIADAVLQDEALLAVQRIGAHLEYGKQALLSPRLR